MEGFSGYNASKLCVSMFESETEGLTEKERETWLDKDGREE